MQKDERAVYRRVYFVVRVCQRGVNLGVVKLKNRVKNLVSIVANRIRANRIT
jgi:hypothetical protein